MMAEEFQKTRFTGALLDADEEGGMEDTIFPGSDEEFGFDDGDSDPEEEESETDRKGYLP